jgi:hypothetical protein
VRKILFPFCLWFAMTVLWSTAAATLTMTDGSSVEGDIVKFDDSGLMLRSGNDSYTNLSWGQFSQDTLKQLSANAKIKPLVEVFIEPDAAQRPARAETNVNPVTRLQVPQNPSLLGGFVKSPVGLFILLVLYIANLYAAFEVSIIRNRSALQVIGLAAVLPVIGPAVFLALPSVVEPSTETTEEAPAESGAAGAAAASGEIEIADASWKQPEENKKVEAQVFARGKFTFNKKFVETKFAGYMGEPKGDALKFSMEIRAAQGLFAVGRILQVAVDAVVLETSAGQVTVPLADVQEIKLLPKAA